ATILSGLGLIVLALLLARSRKEINTAMAVTPATEAMPAQTQPEPILTSSVVAPVSPSKVEPKAPQKSVLQRILNNDSNVFRVSPEVIRSYLARNLTNAESL